MNESDYGGNGQNTPRQGNSILKYSNDLVLKSVGIQSFKCTCNSKNEKLEKQPNTHWNYVYNYIVI